MPWVSIAAIYFVIWALCLFVVLPFGVRSQHEAGAVVPGSEGGAPVLPLLWWKVLATTALAAIVTAILFWLLSNPTLRQYWS